MNTQICPHCRSLLELVGKVDWFAASITDLACPVCGQHIWVPSVPEGTLVPHKWLSFSVLKAEEIPSTPPTDTGSVPSGEQSSILDKTIQDAGNALSNLGKGLYNTGLWIVVVLILAVYIIEKTKK